MKKTILFTTLFLTSSTVFGSDMGRILIEPILVLPVQVFFWSVVLGLGLTIKDSLFTMLIYVALAVVGNLWNFIIFYQFPELFTGIIFFLPLGVSIIMLKNPKTKSKNIEQEDQL
jgi:hypothetical protein